VAVILIVEDETQVRLLAETVLQEAGFETLSAGTVAEAKAILESDQPVDLLFTDMTLFEERDGGLALGQFAAEKRHGLPVLYTTGRGVTDGMLALFVKRHGFLAKPYTGDQLVTGVQNLLR
jgi:DNA-binding NtrC family response regulator